MITMKQRMMDRSLVSLALKKQSVKYHGQDNHEGQKPYSLHHTEFWFTTNLYIDWFPPNKQWARH